jgi:hydroxypyruvate reductase
MAAAFERQGHAIEGGLVVTVDGGTAQTHTIKTIEAGHPIPDERSVSGAQEILNLASGLIERDQLVVLLSGGGSALLCAPAVGLELAQKQSLLEALLVSGAPIEEINCVRKHLSRIKGGRLAAAAFPASCFTFAISDVVGDAPTGIASGPTVQDPTGPEQALEILRTRKISHGQPVQNILGGSKRTGPPSEEQLSRAHFKIIASAKTALDFAEAQARELGLEVLNLGDRVEGEASQVARLHAKRSNEVAKQGKPTLILSGGELTVTKPKDRAIGGPNHEYALALAIALEGTPDTFAIACDTDGKDGSADAAGAIVIPTTLEQARAKGLDPALALKTHESGTFFADIGANVVSGPTQTNINDFRAILIGPL